MNKKSALLIAALSISFALSSPAVRAEGTGGNQQGTSITNPTQPTSKLPKNRSQETNWTEALKADERNWPIDLDDGQKLVRVTTSDPTMTTDLNYDSTYVDADGRTNIRLVYRENTKLTTAVWKRLLMRFDGDLYKQIDWEKSHAIAVKTGEKVGLLNSNGSNEKALDLPSVQGAKGNDRYNVPINLVLNEGVTIKDLGETNYLVQMRLTDTSSERIYAYAPKGTRLDYSTYTKAATIPLANEMDMAFLKGGPEQSHTYALQNSFFTEFIANPEKYPDSSNLGIIRTQYMAQRAVLDPKDEQSGKPSGYVMMFDAKLVPYLKADKNGNIGYTNILKKDRVPNPLQQIGIKEENINYLKDENGENEIGYFVFATQKFQKDGVKVVRIGTDNYDRLTNLGGMYITALDMVVDKTKFEKTFESDGKNKVDFPIMTGWADSNPKGWTIFEQDFDHDFVVPAGQDFYIDTGGAPEGGSVLFQLGDPDDSIIRRPQGYYNGLTGQPTGLDQFKEIDKKKGIYSLTLREGTTIKSGDKLKIFLPDTTDHTGDVYFIAVNNATELNEGSATLKLQADRNINMHLYAENRGEFFKLKYTLKGETKQREMKMTRLGTWTYDNKDKILDPGSNNAILKSGGNFYINTKIIEPGSDIIVEAYDKSGNLKQGMTSSLIYSPIAKSEERYTRPSWLDSTDNLSLITLKKSVYKPYQEIYTNDYAMSEDGLENADKINQIYRDPRSIPASETDFMKDIEKVQGFTRYDGGRIRMLYVAKDGSQHITKTHAEENEYNDKGELVGGDVRKNITVENTKYQAFPYELYLNAFDGVRSNPISGTTFKLYKDMRLMSTASDGSSIPSDWLETRVKTRVLFNATAGAWTEDNKEVKQDVKIVPDNVKFYEEVGYKANGFEGDNVAANTGDKFPAEPTIEGKSFIGWVTEAGLTKLGIDKTKNSEFVIKDKEKFDKLEENTEKFTKETPVERHLVVYAVYGEEKSAAYKGEQKYDETNDKQYIEATPENPEKTAADGATYTLVKKTGLDENGNPTYEPVVRSTEKKNGNPIFDISGKDVVDGGEYYIETKDGDKKPSYSKTPVVVDKKAPEFVGDVVVEQDAYGYQVKIMASAKDNAGILRIYEENNKAKGYYDSHSSKIEASLPETILVKGGESDKKYTVIAVDKFGNKTPVTQMVENKLSPVSLSIDRPYAEDDFIVVKSDNGATLEIKIGDKILAPVTANGSYQEIELESELEAGQKIEVTSSLDGKQTRTITVRVEE